LYVSALLSKYQELSEVERASVTEGDKLQFYFKPVKQKIENEKSQTRVMQKSFRKLSD